MVAAGRVLLWPGLLAVIIVSVSAVPVNYFPINSQLPPVARISEPFSFTFSSLTFFSELPMTYSLGGNAPAWLSIDSDARLLFGTPQDADVTDPGDVVGVAVELLARDATGLAAANATLVVSRNPAPEVEIPLSEQIETIGAYSAPSSLLLYPSRPFSFSFAEQTFRTTEDRDAATEALLNYYAVSGDSAPLPSWVSFDAESLTFAGTTPPFESLVQPPQTFGFQLVASDVLGFASASIPFSIVVGNHELTADEAEVQLNASHGKPFQYGGLAQILNIDGRPLRVEEVTSITAIDLPEWLKFDTETWGLSGTPDAAAESSNVTIAVVDTYSDSLNVTIMIEMEMELFVSDIPDMNITAGSDLSFDLKRYLFDPQKVDISIESQPSSPWIHLDSGSKKLSGTAPEPRAETYAAGITVTFKATLKRGGGTETRTMVLHVVDPSATDPTFVPTTPKETEDPSRRNLLWLLLPFLLLLCIGVILFVLCMRRRRRRINKIDIMEVSAPIPGTFVNHGGSGSGGSSLQDMRKMLDIGPPGTDTIRVVGTDSEAPNGVATSSNLRETRVVSGSSVRSGLQPHALPLYSDRRKSRSDGAIAALRDSWFERPPRIVGGGQEVMDERSLLSDTSLGEGELQVAGEARLSGLARTANDGPYGKNRLMLDVPLISEPFSIQPTPEMAYQPPNKAGRYDLSSSGGSSGDSSEGGEGSAGFSSFSSEPTPIVGYTTRTNTNHHRPRSGLGLGVGSRLSRVLKRVSGGGQDSHRQNRSSNLSSSSTTQTTRTSILTTALAEQRQATTAGPSAVAKPTIVHISNRPGEARYFSRRARSGGDSSPVFFSGGSGGSRRNLTITGSETSSRDDSSSQDEGGETPTHPSPPPRIFVAAPRDSDSSWDRLARNSLGIAYKDLVVPPLAHHHVHKHYDGFTREPFSAPPEKPNWDVSDQWASPASSGSGSDDIGGRSSWIQPLRIPAQIPAPPLQQQPQPLTTGATATNTTTARLRTPEAKGKGKATTITTSSTVPSTEFQTPATSRPVAGGGALHRRQAPISQTTPSPPPRVLLPSPPPLNESSRSRNAAAATFRSQQQQQLPETPTPAGRGGRIPLADRLNEATPNGSVRSAGSLTATGTVVRKRGDGYEYGYGDGSGEREGENGDDNDDDDDMWEDIRPPESTFGADWGDGGEGGSEGGSFAVYI